MSRCFPNASLSYLTKDSLLLVHDLLLLSLKFRMLVTDLFNSDTVSRQKNDDQRHWNSRDVHRGLRGIWLLQVRASQGK